MPDAPDPSASANPAPPQDAPRRVQWDRLTAVMATVVGVCALGVSLYTAVLQNRQIEAQTWPYLQLWNSTSALTFSLSNRGVGPAQVRDVKLRVDGREVDSFGAAFEALSGRKLACSNQSFFARRVVAANEDVAIIQFCNAEDFAVFANAKARMTREICYCSLLGRCAVIDEAADTEDGYERQVDRCPVGSKGVFR